MTPEDLAYVEKVRRATRRFGDKAAEDLHSAVQAVRDAAHFDAEVSTTSARREVELVKTGVKRLSAWYMRYMSAQLETFAGSLVRLGEALLGTTDGFAQRADDLDGRVGSLEQRLVRLEEAVQAGVGPSASSRPGPPRTSSAGSGGRKEQPASGSRSRQQSSKQQSSKQQSSKQQNVPPKGPHEG